MQNQNRSELTFQAEAVVHRVDPISRELAAVIGDTCVTIDVPPGCDVILRGERVKLRMVQPGDRVRIAYSYHREPADSLVARKVEVQPSHRPPTLSP